MGQNHCAALHQVPRDGATPHQSDNFKRPGGTMAAADQARLREVVDGVVTKAGYDLEEMAVVEAGRRRLLRVVIDSDHGVDLDDAAAVSRDISAEFDEMDDASDPMGAAAYTLEVTSPGIGRPLTLPRHYRRARGRLLAITTSDGASLLGRVVRAGDVEVDLLVGKSGLDALSLAYATITRAKVEVEFSSPSAAVLARLGPETAEKFDRDDSVEMDEEDLPEGEEDLPDGELDVHDDDDEEDE